MSTESVNESASHASSISHSHAKSSEQSQLSDSIQHDLTAAAAAATTSQPKALAAKTNNHHQSTAAAASAASATTTTSTTAPGSPTKSTPTKSRNKRRNDARKRSANTKKQQPSTAAPGDSGSSSLQQEGQQKLILPTPPANEPVETKMSTACEQEQREQITSEKSPEPGAPQSPSQTQVTADVKQEIELSNSPVKNHDEQHLSDKPSNSSKGSVPELRAANSNAPIVTTHEHDNANNNSRGSHDTNSWRRKQRENRELKEQIKLKDAQLHELTERVKLQFNRIKELKSSLVNTTRTCSQFERLLQQELVNRNRLEAENDNLNATIARLKNQISSYEKDKSTNNELIRVLNATLMERETEVSILKLKMTRVQTNPSLGLQNNRKSSSSLNKPDPCIAYALAGRSNSEFTRNSYARSTLMAEAINTRSSTSQLQRDDQDASVWATVPEELTPSKRPILLERNLPSTYDHYQSIHNESQSSTPLVRDRRYRTLPKSMRSQPEQEDNENRSNKVEAKSDTARLPNHCLVTNLDESNTSRSSDNRSAEIPSKIDSEPKAAKQSSIDEINACPLPGGANQIIPTNDGSHHSKEDKSTSHYSTIDNSKSTTEVQSEEMSRAITKPPALPSRSPSTPVKVSLGLKKIFGKFKRSDSSSESNSKTDLTSSTLEPPVTPTAGPFQRGATRSTMIGPPSGIRAQVGPRKAIDFQTDKPFAEWDTDMLVNWLTMIGLSMYANQCRRWVRCGAHIMNATPAEVDKGLGITNHLHRKKLRLAISELNGDCDKITKAAAKLDYLWVARWLDDIGLPQYKDAFINARVDGRVLNYLTIEDLVSLNVKSLLHHSSIRCGIKVLRSINFDIQLLKRRATAEEIEQMSSMRQSIEEQAQNCSSYNSVSVQRLGSEADVPLWTCHRVMEWLRMIDFAEFAPNLRGSGVHGGLIMYEDAFNNDTMSTLLSIPSSKTLLRRHLSTFFQNLIGEELEQRKRQHKELSSSLQLNPSAEVKTPKKSPLWFGKLRSSKVGQDGMDEYLCPMYPVEPQMVKSPTKKKDLNRRDGPNLPRIPESVNV